MFEDEQLNKCTNYKEAFGRELISYISLGHLFGCKLTLQGDDVVQRNPSAGTNNITIIDRHHVIYLFLKYRF